MKEKCAQNNKTNSQKSAVDQLTDADGPANLVHIDTASLKTDKGKAKEDIGKVEMAVLGKQRAFGNKEDKGYGTDKERNGVCHSQTSQGVNFGWRHFGTELIENIGNHDKDNRPPKLHNQLQRNV